MKSILHLIPTLTGGGAERQLMLLAIEQVKRGWSVHIGLRDGGEYESVLRDNGVTIHCLGNLKRLSPRLLYRIILLQRRIQPDLTQTWLLQMDILGACAARATGIPWVMTERSSRGAYVTIPWIARLRAQLARGANAIVANSAGGVEYWKSQLPRCENLSLIANGVAIGEIRGTPARRLSTHGHGDAVLLVVGSLIESKGHSTFLAALAFVLERHRVRALIVGSGARGKYLARLTQRLGLSSYVDFEPYRARWWGLLKTSTALVSPSLFEGQPNVVLEAMAAECPVIVSDIPAHRQILDESSALFAPPDSPRALSEAICRHLEAPDSARRRAKRAFVLVRRFTIEDAARIYERVYDNVVAGAGA